MAGKSKIEIFPKDSWTSDEIDSVQKSHLAHGATTCDKTEDATNYILTTVWPVIP